MEGCEFAAVRYALADSLGVDTILLDSFMEGNMVEREGLQWNIISNTKIKTPFFLAGGLNEDNIIKAIETVKPYGVDISGGIETNGFKDRKKIERLMNLIR